MAKSEGIQISLPENGSVLMPAIYVAPLTIGSFLYFYTFNMSSSSSVDAFAISSNSSLNGRIPVNVEHLNLIILQTFF
jgi:hypothetical protein